MEIINEPLVGLKVIKLKRFGDPRGFFEETFHLEKFEKMGLPTTFKQDNFSRSSKGVLRGLHFQKPKTQGKLVRVSRGAVWDHVVDLREGSATYLKHFGLELSDENGLCMYVPEGFAHGFLTLSEIADFSYKCTEVYAPEFDSGIRWNDPDLKIKWPEGQYSVSEKDQKLQFLKDYLALPKEKRFTF